jgi:hypothetical protein
MSATNFPEYARGIEDVLDATVATGEATLVSIQIDQRSSLRGFIAGLLQFNDGSELHFREFVDISLPEPRLMYAYHYQDANQDLISRYDNAALAPHCRRQSISTRQQACKSSRRRRWLRL